MSDFNFNGLMSDGKWVKLYTDDMTPVEIVDTTSLTDLSVGQGTTRIGEGQTGDERTVGSSVYKVMSCWPAPFEILVYAWVRVA